MFQYIISKFFYGILTLFGVATVIFFLFHILPGDPARMMLDQREDSEQLKNIRKKYGFDQPFLKQYLNYINDISPLSVHSSLNSSYFFLDPNKYNSFFVLNIGEVKVVLKAPYLRQSFQKNGKNVSEVLGETLPSTFVLAFSAITLAVIIGIFLGILCAIFKDSIYDKLVSVLSTFGMSVPSFFSAILVAWVFGFVLHDLTGLEMTGSLYEVDDFGENIYINWRNLILPSFVLGIRLLAVIIQLMRNSLLEVLNEDYIRTARAKGLSEYKIIRSHALKNSLNPVITAISGWFASMLAGAVFVEYIFNWNGLGKEIVNSLNTLDLPVINGSVLTIALFFIIINVFVDIIYKWLDPRVSFR